MLLGARCPWTDVPLEERYTVKFSMQCQDGEMLLPAVTGSSGLVTTTGFLTLQPPFSVDDCVATAEHPETLGVQPCCVALEEIVNITEQAILLAESANCGVVLAGTGEPDCARTFDEYGTQLAP